jgi:hypothetical protein
MHGDPCLVHAVVLAIPLHKPVKPHVAFRQRSTREGSASGRGNQHGGVVHTVTLLVSPCKGIIEMEDIVFFSQITKEDMVFLEQGRDAELSMYFLLWGGHRRVNEFDHG